MTKTQIEAFADRFEPDQAAALILTAQDLNWSRKDIRKAIKRLYAVEAPHAIDNEHRY